MLKFELERILKDKEKFQFEAQELSKDLQVQKQRNVELKECFDEHLHKQQESYNTNIRAYNEKIQELVNKFNDLRIEKENLGEKLIDLG